MRAFAEAWPQADFVQQPVGQSGPLLRRTCVRKLRVEPSWTAARRSIRARCVLQCWPSGVLYDAEAAHTDSVCDAYALNVAAESDVWLIRYDCLRPLLAKQALGGAA